MNVRDIRTDQRNILHGYINKMNSKKKLPHLKKKVPESNRKIETKSIPLSQKIHDLSFPDSAQAL